MLLRPIALRWLAPILSASLAASQVQPPNPARARELLLELTSAPRLAGTSASLRGVEFVARTLDRAGFEVEIDEREVLLSLPRKLEWRAFRAADATFPFVERIDHFDPDARPAGDLPKFSAWTASGTVRGQVVDCGFGLRADFEERVAQGVELEGKIALCRYGKCYRGVKVDLATEFGCAGVLLFAEPTRDGDEVGATWPQGPWKPGWAAERGAIGPMGRAPGDPSSPGFGSPAHGAPLPLGARRATRAELDAGLPRIPCLPIGASDARELIAGLTTVRVKQEQGARKEVPLGPGPIEVELSIDAPREYRTIRNVLGRLPGRNEGAVILGNHRDAWVRGAHDAGGGTVALLRACERMGRRAFEGWSPEYSVIAAFWDAEETGLVGSTEWGEAHAEWVTNNALLYVNADAAVSGLNFRASGTPGVEALLSHVLARVPALGSDGKKPRTLFDQWLGEREEPVRLGLPGSGSDYAVFLHHLSVPIIDFSFSGNSGGQYHTSFDDFSFVERFLDPDFLGHENAAQFLETIAVEVAELGPLFFDHAWAADELDRHAREAADWLGEQRATRLANAFGNLHRTCHSAWAQWKRNANSGALNANYGVFGTWPALLEAARETPDGRRAIEAARHPARPRGLYAALAHAAGLPGREWYRNQLWSPALERGYRSETFPLLRLARSDEELDRAVDQLVRAINAQRAAWNQFAEELKTL